MVSLLFIEVRCHNRGISLEVLKGGVSWVNGCLMIACSFSVHL